MGDPTVRRTSAKPKQHPIGKTATAPKNREHAASPATGFLRPGRRLRGGPAGLNEQKVSLLYTDHIWVVGGNVAWSGRVSCADTIPDHRTLMTARSWGRIVNGTAPSALATHGALTERMTLAAKTRAMICFDRLLSAQPGHEYLVFSRQERILPRGNRAGCLPLEWIGPPTARRETGTHRVIGVANSYDHLCGRAVLHLKNPPPLFQSSGVVSLVDFPEEARGCCGRREVGC